MMKSHSDHVILVVPREFGVILSCGGELYNHEMTPEQQLDLATRFIEIATKRIRDGEAERQKAEPDLG